MKRLGGNTSIQCDFNYLLGTEVGRMCLVATLCNCYNVLIHVPMIHVFVQKVCNRYMLNTVPLVLTLMTASVLEFV
jgi:hypothetical protein